MIMRKHALEQSRSFVDQEPVDPQVTVADLQEVTLSPTSCCILVQIYVVQLSFGTRDTESFVPWLSSWLKRSMGYLHFS